jgi:hypothetical protein
MSLPVFSLDDSCKFMPLRGASCAISPMDISQSIGLSCRIVGCSINISHVMALLSLWAKNEELLDTKPDTEIENYYVSNYMFRLYIFSHHQA